MLLAINVALATFLFVRQFDGVGYNIVWGRDADLAVLLHFGIACRDPDPAGNGAALHPLRSRAGALEIAARRRDWQFSC